MQIIDLTKEYERFLKLRHRLPTKHKNNFTQFVRDCINDRLDGITNDI